MANRAALIRATDGAGLPVKRRGRRFIEFDMGGGKTRHVATIERLHKADEVTEIDTAFVADTGAWQWKLAQADFQVHTRNVFNSGALVEWRHSSDQWIIVDPQSINWINEVNSRQQIAIKQAISAHFHPEWDNEIHWGSAYGPGIHYEFLAHPQRLVKHLIIDNLSDLPTPSITGTIHFELEFTLSTSTGVDLWLDGVKWTKANGVRVRTANRIEFRNTANTETLWYADAPTATDANGETVSCQYEVRRQGGPSNLFITVRVPKTWIDTAAFPIEIDPTFTDGYGGDVTTYYDGGVAENNANGRYGTSDRFFFNSAAGSRWIGLLKFDVSSLDGATVTDAHLHIYNTTQYASNESFTANCILDANSTWAENCCWNFKSADSSARWAGDAASDGGTDAGCSVSGTDYNATAIGTASYTANAAVGTDIDFDLSNSQVQAWIDTSNNGLIVRIDDHSDFRCGTSDHATTGYRPNLVVEYSAGGITGAENNQAQKSDAATISAITPATPSQQNQAQVSDLVSLSLATTAIIAAQNNQAQVSDAASLTFTGPTYNISAAQNNQAQVSDAATLGVYTPIAPSQQNQAQVSDAAVITAGETSITAAQNNQAQVSDAATITAVYPFTAAQNNQAQVSDAASITFSGIGTVNVTAAEDNQAQVSDAALLGVYYPISAGDNNQAQVSDAVSVTASGPIYAITVAECNQAQAVDIPGLGVVYIIAPAQNFQAQVSDLAVLSMSGLFEHGERRLYEFDARGSSVFAARGTSVFATRVDLEVND